MKSTPIMNITDLKTKNLETVNARHTCAIRSYSYFQRVPFFNFSALRHLLCVDDPSADVCKFQMTSLWPMFIFKVCVKLLSQICEAFSFSQYFFRVANVQIINQGYIVSACLQTFSKDWWYNIYWLTLIKTWFVYF